MACAGLRFIESKMNAKLLNKHHAVRVADFASEILKHFATFKLKNRKPLQLKVGIHTGPVISGVIGEKKP